jgi:hypothetical protein
VLKKFLPWEIFGELPQIFFIDFLGEVVFTEGFIGLEIAEQQ